MGHLQLLRRAVGQINDPAFLYQIAAIGDANHNGPLVPQIDYPHHRPERKSRVASRHGIHIERFAACSFPSVENRAIPGRNATQQFPALACDWGWVRRWRRQIRRSIRDIGTGRCRWPWHHCIGAHSPGGYGSQQPGHCDARSAHKQPELHWRLGVHVACFWSFEHLPILLAKSQYPSGFKRDAVSIPAKSAHFAVRLT